MITLTTAQMMGRLNFDVDEKVSWGEGGTTDRHRMKRDAKNGAK